MVSHNYRKMSEKPQRPQGIESVQATSVSTYLVCLWLADTEVQNVFNMLKHATVMICCSRWQSCQVSCGHIRASLGMPGHSSLF